MIGAALSAGLTVVSPRPADDYPDGDGDSDEEAQREERLEDRYVRHLLIMTDSGLNHSVGTPTVPESGGHFDQDGVAWRVTDEGWRLQDAGRCLPTERIGIRRVHSYRCAARCRSSRRISVDTRPRAEEVGHLPGSMRDKVGFEYG